MKKIVIFIDGANFNEGFRFARFRPNYSLITKYFEQEGDIVGQYYFTGVKPDGENTSFQGVLDHMVYHGWTVVSKETKEFEGVTKGNMDVEIVCQAWAMWEHFTDLILFSGDGDFAAMVSELQRRGRRVTAVSVHEPGSKYSQMADELRRKVNRFVDLRDIKEQIRMEDTRVTVPVSVAVPAPVEGKALSFLRRK